MCVFTKRHVWTGKVAILKCTGDGLMVPMCDLTLSIREDGLGLVAWAGRAVPAITLRPLPLPGPFVASLAFATDQPLLVEVGTWPPG
ncbi:MAG TPA: hypothetical protein VFG35_04525 [Actinoplanes sp.]|nr:hypothetical protein [Actinoplanes sp.]